MILQWVYCINFLHHFLWIIFDWIRWNCFRICFEQTKYCLWHLSSTTLHIALLAKFKITSKIILWRESNSSNNIDFIIIELFVWLDGWRSNVSTNHQHKRKKILLLAKQITYWRGISNLIRILYLMNCEHCDFVYHIPSNSVQLSFII